MKYFQNVISVVKKFLPINLIVYFLFLFSVLTTGQAFAVRQNCY